MPFRSGLAETEFVQQAPGGDVAGAALGHDDPAREAAAQAIDGRRDGLGPEAAPAGAARDPVPDLDRPLPRRWAPTTPMSGAASSRLQAPRKRSRPCRPDAISASASARVKGVARKSTAPVIAGSSVSLCSAGAFSGPSGAIAKRAVSRLGRPIRLSWRARRKNMAGDVGARVTM
ncbi:hypothetical protein GCM10025880_18330 [Methylorubrum aminovorans]|nr:hypothetical protein GCM10025880_18330 [Methylorubrum aminovorans]